MTPPKTDTPGMARQREKKLQRRSKFGPLLLGLLIVGGIVAILIPLYLARNMMMGSGTPLQTARQFALASPGSQVTIALEVTSMPSSTVLKGTLLQKHADGSYSRTSQTVNVQRNPSQVVMGGSSDVKQGAILQVSGRLGNNDVLIASQVVILTGSVQIK